MDKAKNTYKDLLDAITGLERLGKMDQAKQILAEYGLEFNTDLFKQVDEQNDSSTIFYLIADLKSATN